MENGWPKKLRQFQEEMLKLDGQINGGRRGDPSKSEERVKRHAAHILRCLMGREPTQEEIDEATGPW